MPGSLRHQRWRRVVALAGAFGVAVSVPSALAARATPQAGYNLAFADADARHVLDAVFGDILHLNYSVDPKVAGTITLRTASPVDRDGAIALLEKALEPIGAVIVQSGGSYRVLPKEGARAAALMGSAVSDTPIRGYSSEAVKLRYADPRQIARLIEEFVGKDVVAGIDPAYNQVLLAGSSDERSAALAIVRRFDVDTLSGSTFQLIKLENVDAEALEGELRKIFQPPLDIIGSRVRIVPLPRLHSVLAIAADASDIQRIQPWIERLDAGGASTKRKLYSYAVQNGRARDLAASLQLVLGRSMAISDPTIAQSQPTSTPLLDTGSTRGGLGNSGGFGGSTLAGSSVANQTLEPSQVIGAETPLPGGSNAGLANSPLAQTSQADAGPRIVPVDSTNMLLIYANGEEHDFVVEALNTLDRPVPQIMIEATLAEVSLTKDLQYGVNWSVMSGNSAFALSNTASATPTSSFPGFSYSYIGKSVQAVLNTLQSKTNVRVLSAPKLMVLNNQTATLQVGDEVPIVTQQSQSTIGANAPLVNTVELRDTGVILKVTPRVNDNGTVTLDIAQEVSEVAKTTTSGIDSPTISQRRITSTIATRSGEMVALGGLIRENVTRGRQGFPILSQIPVVGGAFGQHKTSGDRTELIILLTPVVMRSPDEAHSAANELLSRMRSMQPVLDDAVDKTPPHAKKH